MSRKKKEPVFHIADMEGLMDLRRIEGPFDDFESAAIAATKRVVKDNANGFRSSENQAFYGAWYAVHPAGGMADGPHLGSRIAEAERQHNIKDQQSFLVDCGEDKGFIARLVGMFGDVGVLVQRFDGR